MDELEQVVDATAALIDRHVTETLLTKYSLVAHCAAIKRYLLLGQVTPMAAMLPLQPELWRHCWKGVGLALVQTLQISYHQPPAQSLQDMYLQSMHRAALWQRCWRASARHCSTTIPSSICVT